MTANELNLLIDILERRGEDRQLEAATMLRQQQAEIEELKTIRGNSVLVPSDKLQAMQAEIEALKADTIPYKDLHQVVKNVLAQPMRELTDEEILEVWNAFERTDNIPIIDFARAILKKASEK